MRILIVLGLLIFATGCNTIKPKALVNPLLLPTDNLTYLFVTHGIGRHCIGHSAMLTNEMSRQLGFTREKPDIDLIEECQTSTGKLSYPEGQNEACFKMKNCVVLQHDIVTKRRTSDNKVVDTGIKTLDYGYLIVWDLFDSDGRLALRVFELTWSQTTESTKRKFLGTDFKRDSGFKLNDKIHNELINSALSDAILYLGKFKQHIQIPFYDAICYMSMDKNSLYSDGKLKSKCSFKDVFASQLNILQQLQVEGVTCNSDVALSFSKPDLTDSKTEIAKQPRIYSVTASLGSRIFFDILNDLYSFDSEKNNLYELRKMHGLTNFENFGSHLALSGIIFQSRIKNQYLLANQIPLLELVNLSQPGDVLKPQGLKQLTSEEISNMDTKYSEVLVDKACIEDELISLNQKSDEISAEGRRLEQTSKLFFSEIKDNRAVLDISIQQRETDVISAKIATDNYINNTLKAKRILFTELSELLKPHEAAFEKFKISIDDPMSSKDLLYAYYSVNGLDLSLNQDFSILTEWVEQFNWLNSSYIEYTLLHLIAKRNSTDKAASVDDVENIFKEEILKVLATGLKEEEDADADASPEQQLLDDLFSAIDSEYFVSKELSSKNLKLIEQMSVSLKSIDDIIQNSTTDLETKELERSQNQAYIQANTQQFSLISSSIKNANLRGKKINRELSSFQDSFKFLGLLVKELKSDIQLISISDPADILNYELDKEQDWTSNYAFYQNIQNLPIKVNTSLRVPFLYSDIVDSHSNYIRDPKVAWYIACGVNNPDGVKDCLNKKPEEIKGVAEWEAK
jgi:hypothetical protein